MNQVTIHVGDNRKVLSEFPDDHFDCVVTSPPYWGLRDYEHEGQIGREQTLAEFVDVLVNVFVGVRRVLKPTGTCWLNMGDSFNGSGGAGGDYNAGGSKEGQPKYKGRNDATLKPKDLCLSPYRVVLALQEAGWWVRSQIVWNKTVARFEGPKDRPVMAWEPIFLLTKSAKYYYTDPSIAIDDVRRDTWTLAPSTYRGAHFATYPEGLPLRCIALGCPVGGLVLDPFFGAGTTGLAAMKTGRDCVGIEVNPEYAEQSRIRLARETGLFATVGIKS